MKRYFGSTLATVTAAPGTPSEACDGAQTIPASAGDTAIVDRQPDANRRSLPAPPRFARSGQMVTCLRRELLYSEKRARDILFTVIDRLLSNRPDGTIIVARLTREASRLAQLEGERRRYDYSNWAYAGKAVVKALLCSESLLTPGGQPISFGVAAHAAPVASLRSEYRDRAEAYLLEFLLWRLGNVTLRDHIALAHALFRQFNPSISMHDLEDRVATLIARLADRVALDGDRYVVRALDSAATAAALSRA